MCWAWSLLFKPPHEPIGPANAFAPYGFGYRLIMIHDRLRSFRMPDELMSRIDTWSADQEDEPSRAEAIRRLVELGLKKK